MQWIVLIISPRYALRRTKANPAHQARLGDCDTDWRYRGSREIGDLASQALEAVVRQGWVCITGGEPMDQEGELAGLIAELKRLGLLVNIQTSGTK